MSELFLVSLLILVFTAIALGALLFFDRGSRYSEKSILNFSLVFLCLALTSLLIASKIDYTINLNQSQNEINCVGDRCGYLKVTLDGCKNCTDIDFLQVRHDQDTGNFLNQNLASKLRALNFLNTTWRVTEAWPETVGHISACHKDGTCADIGVYLDLRSEKTISRLCQDVQRVGLKITDEYPADLIGPDSACPAPHVFETTTGGHLHVQ